MKAYTTHKLYQCLISGHVLAEVSFSISGPLKAYLHPFSNIETATAYLAKEKRDWLLPCLENFVQHKRHIIEAQPQTAQAVIESLRICTEALLKYQDMATETICTKFLKGFAHFQNILPYEGNPSYQSSVENLRELKKFCETELKPLTP